MRMRLEHFTKRKPVDKPEHEPVCIAHDAAAELLAERVAFEIAQRKPEHLAVWIAVVEPKYFAERITDDAAPQCKSKRVAVAIS